MKFLGVPWGLRPRRTEQKLALSLLSMLLSAHVYRVGARVVYFRGSMATPPILYLRFTASLAVAAQDSRPSGSLLLSCKVLSSSTSCRFIPAHKKSRKNSPFYGPERFPYQPESNRYRCPAGEQLNYVGLSVRNRAHAYIGSAKPVRGIEGVRAI